MINSQASNGTSILNEKRSDIEKDLDKINRNNQSILGFLKAYESVDSDRSGIDPEQRISKNTMISEIKNFATDNKKILSKYNIGFKND